MLFACRYDPYDKKFTEEFYDHELMRKNRKDAIEKAAAADKWGVILGTLGRQASRNVHDFMISDKAVEANIQISNNIITI